MDTPQISVVVPAFRSERYLEGFLSGVLKQTALEALEVVLDLNSPSEEELSIVRCYERRFGSRLVVLRNDGVAPISASMNRAVRSSRAPTLAIWNVDDRRTPDSLRLQLDALDRYAAAVAAYGPFKVVRSLESEVGPTREGRPVSFSELTTGMHLGPFFAFRRTAFEALCGFDEQFLSGADYDFAVRLALLGPIAHVPTLLGYYLNEGRGLSTAPTITQELERTVIDLRYGNARALNRGLVPLTGSFSVSHLLANEAWVAIDSVAPGRKELLAERLRPHRARAKSRRRVRRLAGRLVPPWIKGT